MILPVNADANLKVMLLSREFGLQVYSEVKGRLVVSIMQFFNKLARLMNGSRAVIRQIDSRAQPLEIGGFAAVNRRADQSGGENVVAAHPWPLDRSGEFNGRFSLQKSVDIAQVLAKEVVKFLVISGGVFRSVPQHQSLPSAIQSSWRASAMRSEFRSGLLDCFAKKLRASLSKSQALLSSSAPIQTLKLALIQEPGIRRGRGLGGVVARISEGVSA